jgi:hypothetical protein
VHADEKLTAFVELESAIRLPGYNAFATGKRESQRCVNGCETLQSRLRC